MIEWEYCFVLLLALYISICECISGDCIQKDDCSCTLSETGQVITLWGIDNPNDVRFQSQDVYFPNSTKTKIQLDYNPCTDFSTEQNCHDELICVRENSKYYSAGKRIESHMTVSGGGDVIFEYTGAKQDGIERKTKVTLKCDVNEEVIMSKPTVANNIYEFTLTTRCACPGVCEMREPGTGSNMSVGSILLTIFFVFLAAYFIFGHLFLRFQRNLEGTDAIPNYDFWKEQPTNIKEGFYFTKSKLCGGEQGYDNI